jgi:hypothetical protein
MPEAAAVECSTVESASSHADTGLRRRHRGERGQRHRRASKRTLDRWTHRSLLEFMARSCHAS